MPIQEKTLQNQTHQTIKNILFIHLQIVGGMMIKAVNNNNIDSLNSNNNSYRVKSGDTLSEIAKQKGLGLNDLLKANPQIENPNLIYAGQQINIPGTKASEAGNFDGLRVRKSSNTDEAPPSGILREGSSGPAVSQLQRALADKGFNPGQIDGDFGPRTEAALKAFQRSRGIEADGVFGPQSRAAFSRGPASSSEGRPSRPSRPDNTPDAPSSIGNGSVTYNGKRVSDPVLRDKLEKVADFFGRNITVTSGDRDFVPRGGSRTSLHLAHRAVDLHVQGLSDAEVFSRLKSSGILSNGYEVIRHGPNTATGGPHIHIGRYGDGRPSQFKLEGVPGRAGAGQYVRV